MRNTDMKKNYAIFITIIWCSSIAAVKADDKLHTVVPKDGFVPNSETAIKIAEAVWLPIYGNSIYEKRPFLAILKNGVWHVQGSLPELMVGGVPVIEIAKDDARILRVSHGK